MTQQTDVQARVDVSSSDFALLVESARRDYSLIKKGTNSLEIILKIRVLREKYGELVMQKAMGVNVASPAPAPQRSGFTARPKSRFNAAPLESIDHSGASAIYFLEDLEGVSLCVEAGREPIQSGTFQVVYRGDDRVIEIRTNEGLLFVPTLKKSFSKASQEVITLPVNYYCKWRLTCVEAVQKKGAIYTFICDNCEYRPNPDDCAR